MAGDIPICIKCGAYIFPSSAHLHEHSNINSLIFPKDLFVSGNFISHSGKELPFKIDCDALKESEIECLAERVKNKILFSEVYGIPTGGERLAQALEKYSHPEGGLLIVDDVLTTGTSMEEARARFGRLNTAGVVIFARNDCPDWIQPIFKFNSYFNL